MTLAWEGRGLANERKENNEKLLKNARGTEGVALIPGGLTI